jgi:hypothetical protein
MTRTELIIQLLKVAIGLAFGAYFVWWSLEVLDRLTLENNVPTAAVRQRIMNTGVSAHHEDRTPTHGVRRDSGGGDGCIRKLDGGGSDLRKAESYSPNH